MITLEITPEDRTIRQQALSDLPEYIDSFYTMADRRDHELMLFARRLRATMPVSALAAAKGLVFAGHTIPPTQPRQARQMELEL